MKHLLRSGLAALVALTFGAGIVRAQEHPGEHPGKKMEHPGKAPARNIKGEIQSAIKLYVQQKSGKDQVYKIADPKKKTTWQLKLTKFHPVTKISDSLYFDCTDFAAQGKNTLDLDFFLKPKAKGWEVTRVLIHKVNGNPRYTYEQKGSKWFRVEGKTREPLS